MKLREVVHSCAGMLFDFGLRCHDEVATLFQEEMHHRRRHHRRRRLLHPYRQSHLVLCAHEVRHTMSSCVSRHITAVKEIDKSLRIGIWRGYAGCRRMRTHIVSCSDQR